MMFIALFISFFRKETAHAHQAVKLYPFLYWYWVCLFVIDSVKLLLRPLRPNLDLVLVLFYHVVTFYYGL